jgi:hypothetical protein
VRGWRVGEQAGSWGSNEYPAEVNRRWGTSYLPMSATSSSRSDVPKSDCVSNDNVYSSTTPAKSY